jgi:hypothetical protein
MHTEAQYDPNYCRLRGNVAVNNAAAVGATTTPQAMISNVVSNAPTQQVQVNEAMATFVCYADTNTY